MLITSTLREPFINVRHAHHDRRNRRFRLAPPRRQVIAAVGLSVLLVPSLVLSGCSNAGSNTSSTEARVGGAATAKDSAGRNAAPELKSASGADTASGTKAAPGVPSGAAGASKPGAPVPGVGPKLTRSASLDLQVKDIPTAAARVRSTATALQAQVVSEQIGKGGPGDPTPLPDGGRQGGTSGEVGDLAGGFGTLTLSVPADKLDAALDQLAKIGAVVRRNASSQDVTSQYVDTESRLKTMRASVDRVRALMARAKDIGQVVTLESEMSRRQADLESLESQLGALKNSVERSTLAVSLSTPGNEPVTDSGFVAGLRSGWDAFTASASGLFKAIGATLPFLLFFAAVGIPLWMSWRRRRTTQPTVSPATP